MFMNKKIIFGCSLVLIMSLSSCNRNKFTRDSFKEVAQDTFITNLNKIKENAKPANLNKKGKANYVNNIKHYSKINELLYWDVNYTRNFSYEWSEDDNYIKLTCDVNGRYDYSKGYYIIDTKESFTHYIKKIGDNYYYFTKDNLIGTKYKNLLSDVKSIKEELLNLLNNMVITPMYYDVCETTAGHSQIAALSDGYLLPSIYGEDALYSVYGKKEVYKKYIDDCKGDSVVNFGSNDEKSASYKLKGTISAQNYLKMMLGDDSSSILNPSGNANLDYYFSFKDNFFSQSEFSNKYDITYETKVANELLKHNCVNNCYFNFQATLGECNPDTIDANQYIEIDYASI